MLLYNIKTKEIEDLDVILIDENQMYTEFLTKEEIKNAGYKFVVQSEKPKILNEFQKLQKSSEEDEYNYIIKYEIIDCDIDYIKQKKLDQVKIWAIKMTERSKVNLKGFGLIDAGYNYITNAEALINNFDLLPQKVFRMYNNDFKIVSKEDLIKVKRAIEVAGITIHSLKWGYEKAIQDAKTIEDIKKIKFTDTIEVSL